MKNEIIEANKSQLATMDKKEISDIIKPLKTEIYLFDSHVAGISKIKNFNIKDLKIGDELTLIREESRFDENNINIMKDNKKIGYIPEKDNVVFARLMDAGKLLIAKVNDINVEKSFPIVNVGIYLVDY